VLGSSHCFPWAYAFFGIFSRKHTRCFSNKIFEKIKKIRSTPGSIGTTSLIFISTTSNQVTRVSWNKLINYEKFRTLESIWQKRSWRNWSFDVIRLWIDFALQCVCLGQGQKCTNNYCQQKQVKQFETNFGCFSGTNLRQNLPSFFILMHSLQVNAMIILYRMQKVGQSDTYSEMDFEKINKLYKCSKKLSTPIYKDQVMGEEKRPFLNPTSPSTSPIVMTQKLIRSDNLIDRCSTPQFCQDVDPVEMKF